MKYLKNEDGIALITALMFTLICLAMVMTLMYYVLTATKMSAAQKKYRSSLEASYGGVEVVTKSIIPRLFADYSTGRSALNADFGDAATLGLQLGPDLQVKLANQRGDLWGAASTTVDPKDAPDMVFTLKGQGIGGDFRVYSKIVDTISGVGLLDASGIDYLDAGMGVAGTSTSTQTPRTPNIYSVEVQGEAAVNPKEKAALSVLYAY
jgi:hypothetical protein